MKEKDIVRPYMENNAFVKWWYKIPDSKFTGKKPFDVVGIGPFGKPLAIEFKIHKTLNKWSYSKVIDYQEKSLSDFAAAGGDAKIILAIRVTLSEDQKTKLDIPKRIGMYKQWTIEDFKKAREESTHFDVKKYVMEYIENVRRKTSV